MSMLDSDQNTNRNEDIRELLSWAWKSKGVYGITLVAIAILRELLSWVWKIIFKTFLSIVSFALSILILVGMIFLLFEIFVGDVEDPSKIAFEELKNRNTSENYIYYLQRYPSGQYSSKVLDKLRKYLVSNKGVRIEIESKINLTPYPIDKDFIKLCYYTNAKNVYFFITIDGDVLKGSYRRIKNKRTDGLFYLIPSRKIEIPTGARLFGQILVKNIENNEVIKEKRFDLIKSPSTYALSPSYEKPLSDVYNQKLLPIFIELLYDIYSSDSLMVFAIGDENKFIRSAALNALKRSNIQIPIEPLINNLKNTDIFIRKIAAEALGNIKDYRAVEPLISVLDDESENIRIAAASALEQIVGENFGQEKEKWDEWWMQNKGKFINGR